MTALIVSTVISLLMAGAFAWWSARRDPEDHMTWGEASWILEDNAAMANAAKHMGFRLYKTYRLYDRAL